MQLNMKKNYFWNTLGVFLQNALSPLLLIAVMRINGIYDAGIFTFAFSIAIVFWAIAMWGGRTYQVSDTKEQFKKQSYIFLRIILAFMVMVGAYVFVLVNNYDNYKTTIILILVLVKVIESIADSLYGVMQTGSKLYVSGISLTIKTLLSIASFIMIDFYTNNLLLAVWSIVFINILVILLYDIPNVIKVSNISFYKNNIATYYKEALIIMKKCWIVFLVSFLAFFSLNIPRYYIDLYHADEIGYFGVIAMPITLIVLLMSFILQPNIVSLSRMLDKNETTLFSNTVKKIVFITLFIGLIVFVVTYFFGVQVLNIVFDNNFNNYSFALYVIVLGALANAILAVYATILTIMRKFNSQIIVLLVTNIILLVVCNYVVKDHSVNGGVILYTVINIIQVTLFYYFYKRYLKNFN